MSRQAGLETRGRAPATRPVREQSAAHDAAALRADFVACRAATERLCAPLAVEDHVVQPAPFVSPPKWHLAHTTWFFETFLLDRIAAPRERLPDAALLFNSYYKSQGEHWLQGHRGHLSRPTLAEVLSYRERVSGELLDALDAGRLPAELLPVLALGIEHERQHQELLLMDIKFIFAGHPSPPAYASMVDRPSAKASEGHDGEKAAGARTRPPASDFEPHRAAAIDGSAGRSATGATVSANKEMSAPPEPFTWLPFDEGLRRFGAADEGFAFDNERPRHRRWLDGFALASRLVSNADWLAFIADGGYERPTLWLSDGWDWRCREGVSQPLYWRPAGRRDDAQGWLEYQMDGLAPLRPELPVMHLSYYEADAYARWAGARLPTEFELECLLSAQESPTPEAFWAPGEALLPLPGKAADAWGNGLLWQWTASPYAAYPGYAPPAGALGEYNGKFMCEQFVLRGGCVATPRGHWRPPYRNFYRARDRWAFSGLRLARDLGADS